MYCFDAAMRYFIFGTKNKTHQVSGLSWGMED